MKYVPSTVEDPAWTPALPALACNVDPVAGVPIEVAIAATFVDSCNLGPPPAGIGLINGPIQAYLWAVPEDSPQEALTAEEGYFVFGWGAAGEVDPWADEMQMFIRTPTKSTLLTTMAALGVPVSKAKGIQYDKSSDVVNALLMTTTPDVAIGILGAEIYDKNRDTLEALAFRAFKQKYAYFPDSTRTATDKQNLRDGHYTVWSPTVYMTAVDGNGQPTNARADYLIDLVLGNPLSPVPVPAFDSLETVIAQGIIPDCAMKVSREFEGGDLSLYDPPEPCHCYYESKVNALGPNCTECMNDNTCGGGKCRHGYCEAH
jgi:hypothetical protein